MRAGLREMRIGSTLPLDDWSVMADCERGGFKILSVEAAQIRIAGSLAGHGFSATGRTAGRKGSAGKEAWHG